MLWYFIKHFWQIMKFVFWDKKYMAQELNSKLIKINDEISYLDASDDPISSNVVFIKPKNSQTTWIFDVGMTSLAAQEINAVQGKKIVVISHFHPDHLFNINRISYDELYLSAHTFKYAKKGIVVKNKEFSVDAEVSLLTENSLAQVEDARFTENSVAQVKNSQSSENQLAQTEVARLTENSLAQTEVARLAENSLAQAPQNPKIKIMELPSSHAKGSLMLQYGDYVFTGDGTYCTIKKGEHVYNANLLFDEIQTLENLDCKYLCLSHERNFVQKKETVLKLHKDIYFRRKANEVYISVEDFFDSKGNVL